jgi:hypothetical protein
MDVSCISRNPVGVGGYGKRRNHTLRAAFGDLVESGLSASRVRQAYNLLGGMMKKAV